jgi:hypothetical protein
MERVFISSVMRGFSQERTAATIAQAGATRRDRGVAAGL